MTNLKKNDAAKSLDKNESKPITRAGHGDPERAEASLKLYGVKERMRAAHKSGPSRPLSDLAKVEADFEIRSQDLQVLSAPKQKTPDKDLLIHQLTDPLNTSRANRTIAPKLRRNTISLYSALNSSDPLESILDRHIVTMSNAAMQCQSRGAFACNLKALDINLRHAEKMTKLVIELIEAREHRRRPNQVVVGNVNVEAGGQAIVGTVAAHKPPHQSDEESDRGDEPDDDWRP